MRWSFKLPWAAHRDEIVGVDHIKDITTEHLFDQTKQ